MLRMFIHYQKYAGGGAEFTEDLAQGFAPFTGGDARLGAGNRRFHDVAGRFGGFAQGGECGDYGLIVACGAPAFKLSICSNSMYSETVRTFSSSPAESGEVSVVIKILTPTRFVSPRSMAFKRSVLD